VFTKNDEEPQNYDAVWHLYFSHLNRNEKITAAIISKVKVLVLAVKGRQSMERRFTNVFLVAVTTLFLLNQPVTVWGQFQNLGGIIFGDPSCASADDGTGQVICGVRGTNNALLGKRFDPRTGFSTGFQNLGGIIAGDPSCASADNGTGQVICGVRGQNNTLFGIRFDPQTSFSTGFQGLGGFLMASDPSCASAVAGGVTCGFRASNNALIGVAVSP
jgi:hypothetical protein